MKKVGYIEPKSYFPKPLKAKKTTKTQAQDKAKKEEKKK